MYIAKKYEGKNAYNTPWGSCSCIIESGFAIIEVSDSGVSKYLSNMYGFKPFEYKPKPKKVIKKVAKKTTKSKAKK